MSVTEFKAFLEGMGIQEGCAPTVDQWERIAAKIDGLRDSPYHCPDISQYIPRPIVFR